MHTNKDKTVTRRSLGIRGKVRMGFVVIGLILFFSGAIALFEFRRMSNYVSSLIADNVVSVNSSRLLHNLLNDYNTQVFEAIGNRDLSHLPKRKEGDEFLHQLERVMLHVRTRDEHLAADSVRYAYAAYMQVSNELDELWSLDHAELRSWYFNRLQVVYEQLNAYLQALTEVTQKALADNYFNLQDSFYRSIMPGVVAVGAGIILVLLFNYFLNIFLLTPLMRMNRAIQDYRDYNKSYDVKFDRNGDQVEELSDGIREIIEENKLLKKNR
ncbi:MAG: hypothetical protein IKV28_00155 [Bacteroidales bacterium]|nr:hypothetical protein [Bacteroidales bacterium]